MVYVADYYEAFVVRRDSWLNYYNPRAGTLAPPGDQGRYHGQALGSYVGWNRVPHRCSSCKIYTEIICGEER